MSDTVEQDIPSSVFAESAMTQAMVLASLLNHRLESLAGKSGTETNAVFSFETRELPDNEYLCAFSVESADHLPSILINSGVEVAGEQVNLTAILANIANLSPLPAIMEQILEAPLAAFDWTSNRALAATETSPTSSYAGFGFTCFDREISFYIHESHLGAFLQRLNGLSGYAGDVQNTPVPVSLSLHGPRLQQEQFPLFDGDVIFINQPRREQPMADLGGFVELTSTASNVKKYFSSRENSHQHRDTNEPDLLITLQQIEIPVSLLTLSETDLSGALAPFFALPQKACLTSRYTEENYPGTIFRMGNSICFRVENGQRAPEIIRDTERPYQPHATALHCTDHGLTENGSVYERLFGTGR
ncbi:MAG: hypothetical protein MRY59_04325 [Aquisalinus sp.]|nr:hypothetical protein [Aquisalinus sp.]